MSDKTQSEHNRSAFGCIGPASAAIADEAEALELVHAVTKIATHDLSKAVTFSHVAALSAWMESTAEAAGVMKSENPEIAAQCQRDRGRRRNLVAGRAP